MKKVQDTKTTKAIELTDAEKTAIETQRESDAKRNEFIQAYQKLVDKYGYAIAVDPYSPLNNIRITVVKHS